MTLTIKTLKLTASLAAFLTLAAGSASAMDMDDMTCAEFTAMSSDDQKMALEALQAAPADGMAADVTDGMASDQMASDNMAATDSMAAADSMASDDAMASNDAMAAITAACKGHPEMKAADAMGTDAMAPATSN